MSDGERGLVWVYRGSIPPAVAFSHCAEGFLEELGVGHFHGFGGLFYGSEHSREAAWQAAACRGPLRVRVYHAPSCPG